MAGESIYGGAGRLAQPDEVWNYGRGDGVEKALLLANIFRQRAPDESMTIDIFSGHAKLKAGSQEYVFATGKGLPDQVWEVPPGAQ